MSDNNETNPLARVDRKTASKLNPAIDEDDARGTCANVSIAMGALGNAVRNYDFNADAFGLLQDMLAAALWFELQPHEEAKPEEKEAPVKRVK
ncbi:MAG: hypothetical protein ACREVK_08710 [Gammaproteobacteria bacterium]